MQTSGGDRWSGILTIGNRLKGDPRNPVWVRARSELWDGVLDSTPYCTVRKLRPRAGRTPA